MRPHGLGPVAICLGGEPGPDALAPGRCHAGPVLPPALLRVLRCSSLCLVPGSGLTPLPQLLLPALLWAVCSAWVSTHAPACVLCVLVRVCVCACASRCSAQRPSACVNCLPTAATAAGLGIKLRRGSRTKPDWSQEKRLLIIKLQRPTATGRAAWQACNNPSIHPRGAVPG